MATPFWEKKDHGDQCRGGIHVPYRVRTPSHVEVRCKVCRDVTTELYEHSYLQQPEGEEEAA